MNIEKLFWSIFNAEDEDELHKIVMRDKFLSDNNNWFPYGGRDQNDRSNFGTFENQAANPVPALIEKITNSIDALLLRKCRLANINPKGEEAPLDMATAVEKFFGIKNGDFSEVPQAGRRSIAEEIQIVAEGDKQTPNLLVYDNGEGQHPDDFPNTFLSLLRCNKTDIPFVQGKYNMGSTGAVIFCGNYRYQLIGSKLSDELNTRESNEFGFTLIRRHPLTNEEEEGGIKTSWYEYFTIDNKIPRFLIKELDLGLYERKFITGSIVKLYSYGLPRGSRSNVTWDLWRDLNQYLYHPALPFLVCEKRWPAKTGKNPSKLVLGNKIRLTLDERDRKEKTITISTSDSKFGQIAIEVHVFQQSVDQKEFINNRSAIFTINGQVHGFLPRTFVSHDLGFSLLRDHMLIQVDCTKIKTSVRQDLFKGSRDRLNEGLKTEELIEKIINVLKENEELRYLNQSRKNKILRESVEDKSLLANVLSNLPIDKEIIKLLKSNAEFNLFKRSSVTKKEDKDGQDSKKQKFISKRFPSIFKIELNQDKFGKKLKSIPLNGKGVINFETDVEDEYLFRPKEKGELEIAVLGIKPNSGTGGEMGKPSKIEDIFSITKTGPTENSIKITFEPKEMLNIGDEIELNARLSSPSGDIESIFWVRIIGPQVQGDKIKEDKKDDVYAPPMPIRVFQHAEKEDDKTWAEYGWSGDDIVKIITSQIDKERTIIEAIAINMDCFVLKRFLSQRKIETEEEIKLAKNKFFLSVYLHSLFLYSILDHLNKDENCDTKIDPEDIVPLIFKPYSGFLLSSSMIDGYTK